MWKTSKILSDYEELFFIHMSKIFPARTPCVTFRLPFFLRPKLMCLMKKPIRNIKFAESKTMASWSKIANKILSCLQLKHKTGKYFNESKTCFP